MKKLVNKILLFLLPVLIVMAIAEILIRQMPNDYKLKRTLLLKHAANIEVLCLGSSHSYYNINPEYFSVPAFNAAHSSQTLNYDWFLLRKYQDSFPRLQYILLPISYQSLFESLDDAAESWRIKDYKLYYDINENNYLPYNFEVLSMPPRFNSNKIIDYYGRHQYTPAMNEFGYATTYHSSVKNDLQKMGREAAARNYFPNKKHLEENLVYLQKIINWAANRHVQVILFTSPAFEYYRNNLNSAQVNETQLAIKKIVSKNKHVSYNNFMNSSAFGANDFYDADHLNEIGAKKFTFMLNQLITKNKALK